MQDIALNNKPELSVGSIYIIQQINDNGNWEDTAVKSKVIGIIEAALNVMRKEDEKNNAMRQYRVIAQTRKVIEICNKNKL